MDYSQAFLKRRRFLTVLPFIVLPFAAVVFWLLGGGSGSAPVANAKTGLNTQLPDANLKGTSALDKLSFYAMAERDSIKKEEQKRMDPNYQPTETFSDLVKVKAETYPGSLYKNLQIKRAADPGEGKGSKPVQDDPEMVRLQEMIQSVNHRKPDPEMEQLNSALDKLMELQHPSPVKKEEASDGGSKRYKVTAGSQSSDESYFGKGSVSTSGGFLSDNSEKMDTTISHVIMAAVHGEQTFVSGSVVKMRLLQDVFVGGEKIPQGSFVFGVSTLENERLMVNISSIQFHRNLFPVALSVYDMDGIKGIHIPGSIDRSVIKQSADQGIQAAGVLSLDPSLKAQAASAGINAAKSFLSQKVRLVRVTVKAGYKVLLKDENEKK